MGYVPKNLRETIIFEEKKHGLFTIVSYACEYSKILNHTKVESDNILGNLLEAKNFEERVGVFKHHFGHILNITKIERFSKIEIRNNDIAMGRYGC